MRQQGLGLDWFELAVHVGITGMLMIVVDSASHNPGNSGAIAGVVAVSLVVLAWRRKRALERRGPELNTDPGSPNRLYDLESRVADLEASHSRIMELEERLDFSERLLTQQRDTLRQLVAPKQEA
jgi:hypothetical protein